MLAPSVKNNTVIKQAITSLIPTLKKALFFSALSTMLTLTPIIYMKSIYGPVINSGDNFTLLWLTILLLLSLTVLEALNWIRLRLLTIMACQFYKKLAPITFNKTFENKPIKTSVATNQALTDLKTLRDFLPSSTVTAILDAPISLLFIGIVFYINTQLGVITCLGALIICLIAWRNETKTEKKLSTVNKKIQTSNNFLDLSMQNAPIIRALGMNATIKQKWDSTQNDYIISQAEASDLAGTYSAISKFVVLSQSSLMLGFGAYLIIEGDLSDGGGLIIMASMISNRAISPLMQFLSGWKKIIAAKEAALRLRTFLEKDLNKKTIMSLPAPEGKIVANQIFAYAPNSSTVLLTNISFIARPKEIWTITGASGSGKSTLAKVICGLQPVARGTIKLDGVSLFDWDKSELGPHLGYLPQEVKLFDGTISENISRFSPTDSYKLKEALEITNLTEFVNSLPDKQDTGIGMGGYHLSGGMRQRLGLARAIYGLPKLIVLDEPNANLDKDGHAALMKTIKHLKQQQSTIFIVSHSNSLLKITDKMIALKNTKCLAIGHPAHVLKKLSSSPKIPTVQGKKEPKIKKQSAE
jgi:ATP-binding cassette, subfamily C, bacterial exporter for protease/lipase